MLPTQIVSNNEANTLHHACSTGDINQVADILRQNADLLNENCADGTPLHFASFNGHIELMKLLIESGADISLKACIILRTKKSYDLNNIFI